MKEQNVGEIRGVVSFGEIDGNPTEDVVAEVYRFKIDDPFQNIEKVIASNRIAACNTGGDGQFSFPYLASETYLLRIGTRNVMGINEVHAIMPQED